jgi:hypothetical protein
MFRRLLKILVATSLLVGAFPLVASADNDVEFKARLSPGQEVANPPVVSDGEGSAQFDLRKDRVKFRLKWEDLTSPVIFAHIHCAVKGVNGPVGVTLIHEMMDDEGRVRGSFTAPDAGNACGWTTLADVIGALATGGAYVNIHTEMFQGGEIRGQVKTSDLEFESNLSPRKEVPPTDSDGDGEADFDVRKNKVKFDVEWDDLTSPVISAHIHCAVKGVNGPVGVTLIHETMDDEGRVKGSFTTPDAGNGCGWDSLADVIGAMATGGAYVNIHTDMFQGGEIRGQVRVD